MTIIKDLYTNKVNSVKHKNKKKNMKTIIPPYEPWCVFEVPPKKKSFDFQKKIFDFPSIVHFN